MMTYRNNLSPGDAELATKLRDTGDAAAFETLYLRHAALISAFLFRLAGERGPSLLGKLIDRLRDRSYAIRDVENFHLWAIGVAASFWREETKEDELPRESDPISFQAIHRLAHYLRPVFVLVHYFQLPIDDVAAALRISRGTATSRLQDAFASLVAQVAPAPPPPPAEEDLSVEIVAVEPAPEAPALPPIPKAEAPREGAEAGPIAEVKAEPTPAKEEPKAEAPKKEEPKAEEAKPVSEPEKKASEEKPVAAQEAPKPPPLPPPLPPPVAPLLSSPLTPSTAAPSLATLIPKLSFDAPEPKEPEKKS